MRNDLPPIKSPTGKQVRLYIKSEDGEKMYLLASDEVNGEYHVIVPVKEFRITVEELEEAKGIFNHA